MIEKGKLIMNMSYFIYFIYYFLSEKANDLNKKFERIEENNRIMK